MVSMYIGERSLYLTTAQAAQALGISLSTLKRWVDSGVLPAHRTAGGHRKLLRTEVIALSRGGGMPVGDLTALTPISPRATPHELQASAADLRDSLLLGRGAEVTALIRKIYRSGVSIAALADHVVAPAMASVGHEWETARIDVWLEHRGTLLCSAALYELREELQARAERQRPVAIGCAPVGDHYLLPTLLAELVLLDAGWNVVQLGPNTPLASLAQAMDELHARLVWLSASHLVDRADFISAYRDFYQNAERTGTAVAIGGRALSAAVRAQLPYTTFGDAMGHLEAFACTLHPRPKRPRPGRPHKR
jgi:excisionase family DNA binding protein